MGFRVNGYATVWEVTPGRGNFTRVRISTSRKNKETGAYEQDFSGYCTFVGPAHATAQSLKERDRIVLEDIEVTTSRGTNREGQPTTYTNYTVFRFSKAVPYGQSGQSAQRQAPQSASPLEQNPADGSNNEVEDELPF